VQSPGRACGVESPHPDQGRSTALPMEVTAVVTAVCSACVLRSLGQTGAGRGMIPAREHSYAGTVSPPPSKGLV
jgi:hypothetical protein